MTATGTRDPPPREGASAAPPEDLYLTIRMDKRVDLAIAVAIVALGAAAIWIATGFRVGRFPDPLTSRGLPYLLGGFMVAGGLALALRRLLSWRELPGHLVVSEGVEDEPGHPASSARAFAIMGLAFLWALLLRPLGFLIVTPLATSAMLAVLGERGWGRLAAFPVLFALVLWLAFAQAMGLSLPLGPLAPIARAWGLIY